ncbi:hypothetical protein MRS44_011865 [Fusarium solani]|uniref:uncharacterized protein n=1 Tax=Fusarium solani TaxID=169388 RepID=UPI0032C3EA73|nr:hypothetical protein MRS44_011865 [Fusarium solani]
MDSPLTLWEKFDLVLGLASVCCLRQHRYLETGFEEEYVKWCKANSLTPDLVTTSAGLKGFWVGDRSSRNIIINYHGGGFVMDGSVSYLSFWSSIQHHLSDRRVDAAFFFPCYRLAPENPHPAQYQDAVEALRYVINDLKRSPSDIILAGDSSGGNLALAVLSHVSGHELPYCPKLTIEQPLKAMALISPAVSFDLDKWPSVRRNSNRDYLVPDLIQNWNEAWLSGTPVSEAFEPCRYPSSWWKNAMVKQTLVVAASDELELDSIASWVETFQVESIPSSNTQGIEID